MPYESSAIDCSEACHSFRRKVNTLGSTASRANSTSPGDSCDWASARLWREDQSRLQPFRNRLQPRADWPIEILIRVQNRTDIADLEKPT